MRVACPVVLVTFFVTQLSAQDVTVTASVVVPGDIVATSGTMVTTSPTPASGAVSLSAIVSPGTGGPGLTLASRGFSVLNNGLNSRQVTYRMNGLISGAPGSSVVDPHEAIIELTAPASRVVELAIDQDFDMPPGAAVPRLDFDLGDDGTLDFPGARTITVGPAPYRIRIFGDFELTSTGGLALGSVGWNMTVRPDNGVNVQQVVAGCTDAPIEVFEPFASDGIEVRVPLEPEPVFVVLGFSAQPVTLPITTTVTPFPCVLYPSADVVVFFPSGVGSSLSIPLPPAVRPASFYVQGVEFFGLPYLYPTDAFFVTAN